MALLDVRCYFNTGFGVGNIPSTPAILEKATYKDYPPIWKLQSQGLATVRIKAEWSEISQVDYVKIGVTYYTVDGVSMTNGNVAELNLRFDPINTVGGVTEFNILDGWATRISPISDTLFQNIYPEPWSPRRELYIEPPISMTGDVSNWNVESILGCTVDILNFKKVADAYGKVDVTTGAILEEEVFVPHVEPLESETRCYIESQSGFSVPLSQVIPATQLYTLKSDGVKDGISTLRSLGLEDTIVCSYRAPEYYIDVKHNGSKIESVTGKLHSYESPYKYKYGTFTPKNLKTYCLYNTFHVACLATGETADYEARELYNGSSDTIESAPSFWIYADPAPSGKPYCQPKYYEKSPTKPFQNAVQGASWLTAPIIYTDAEALALKRRQFDLGTIDLERQFGIKGSGWTAGGKTLDSISDIANVIQQAISSFTTGGLLGAGAGAVQGVFNNTSRHINFRNAMSRHEFDYTSQLALVEPKITFPHSPEIQGYIGNGFMIYRTCLQQADVEALDNFLTMYGYANSRRLTQVDLTSHVHFNYVQANNVAVTGKMAMWIRNAISDYFASGVRLWHELPNRAAMLDNPIKPSVLAKGVKEEDVV